MENERTGKRESVDLVARTKGKRLRGWEGVGMHASTYRDALMCWNSFRPGLGKKPYVCVLLLKARKPAIEMNRKAFAMRSSNVQFTHHAWHT